MSAIPESQITEIFPHLIIKRQSFDDENCCFCSIQPRLPDGNFRPCTQIIAFGQTTDAQTGQLTEIGIIYRTSCVPCY